MYYTVHNVSLSVACVKKLSIIAVKQNLPLFRQFALIGLKLGGNGSCQ